MICDEIVSWASACPGTSKHSSKPCSAGQKSSLVHSYSLYRLWFGTKSSHLGINVSMCTKIVSKNVLSESKNPQVQSKPSYKLWFATKSSPGHNLVEGYRNTPKNVLRKSKKLPGTVKFALQAMICDEIVSWASTCRGTLKQSSKTCSAGRKTPSYSQNRTINYDLRRNRLLGIKVSRYTEAVLENVLSVSKNPQAHSNSRGSYLLGMSVSPRTGRVVRHVLSE